MKPSGQRIKEQMLESAHKALEMTAQDVLRRAQSDAPVDTGELKASGRVETVRVGDQLLSKVEFTADHAASQEIGGRSRIGRDKTKPGGFIRFQPGQKDHYLSDSLKSGVRKYRANLKKVIRNDLKAR